MSTESYFDVAECLRRIGGNKKILKTLLSTFERDTSWQKLSDAIESENIADAALAAHAIKGMCANLSMKELSAKASELEILLKAGTIDRDLFRAVGEAYEKTLAVVGMLIQELA